MFCPFVVTHTLFSTLRVYVYVGVTSSYFEAAKRGSELSNPPCWEALFVDNLVGHILGLLAVMVGAITGHLQYPPFDSR